MILANATDIIFWANRREAQDQLPRLMRFLIHATANRVHRISFPADESVQMGGWDGAVVVEEGNAFLPDGSSVWELGTNSNVKIKADRDYSKRCLDPLGLTPSDTVFVFVTPRRWVNKDIWVADRNAEGIWHEVRVYDAEDLAQWLEIAPSVHIWLSKLIGKYPEGVTSFEHYWSDWSESTKPAVVPDLVLAGRDQAVEQIYSWLRNEPSAIALHGETQDEALAFLLAALYKLPISDRIPYLAKGVIINDAGVWQQLAASVEPLILAPLFDEPAGVGIAVKRGHHVLIAQAKASASENNAIEIPRLRREQAQQVLAAMGFTDHQANAFATLARRSFTAFRRQIANGAVLHRPAWAKPEQARFILPALLIGTWADSNEADRKVVETFASSVSERSDRNSLDGSRCTLTCCSLRSLGCS